MSKVLPNIATIDLCHLRNAKLNFFEAILFKFKSCLNRRLHENSIPVTKYEAANCSKSGK